MRGLHRRHPGSGSTERYVCGGGGGGAWRAGAGGVGTPTRADEGLLCSLLTFCLLVNPSQ